MNASQQQIAKPLYVRPARAARLLDVGRSKLYELIRTGEIRAIKIGGCLRVPMSEIELLAQRFGVDVESE